MASSDLSNSRAAPLDNSTMLAPTTSTATSRNPSPCRPSSPSASDAVAGNQGRSPVDMPTSVSPEGASAVALAAAPNAVINALEAAVIDATTGATGSVTNPGTAVHTGAAGSTRHHSRKGHQLAADPGAHHRAPQVATPLGLHTPHLTGFRVPTTDLYTDAEGVKPASRAPTPARNIQGLHTTAAHLRAGLSLTTAPGPLVSVASGVRPACATNSGSPAPVASHGARLARCSGARGAQALVAMSTGDRAPSDSPV